MLLVRECYSLTSQLPVVEEFGLKSQMRRAAISIPSNIAEGHTRHHTKEFLQFLATALGSLAELETQLELLKMLCFISEEAGEPLAAICQEAGKMLNGLRAALYRHCAPNNSP